MATNNRNSYYGSNNGYYNDDQVPVQQAPVRTLVNQRASSQQQILLNKPRTKVRRRVEMLVFL